MANIMAHLQTLLWQMANMRSAIIVIVIYVGYAVHAAWRVHSMLQRFGPRLMQETYHEPRLRAWECVHKQRPRLAQALVSNQSRARYYIRFALTVVISVNTAGWEQPAAHLPNTTLFSSYGNRQTCDVECTACMRLQLHAHS